ncbi:hypothetical protein [Methanolobus sp.]|uniref:hypothetical protein n=1 Tax=Methanolobus sp. TaxID=1874737 RepID=UPI0025EB039A|nr:hypothetical protein [Methanolobus sp.]
MCVLIRSHIAKETYLLTIASSILLAFYLVWFISVLDLRKIDAYILTGIMLFIVRDLNNLIEAYFYMDIFNETFTLVAAIVISLITTLIQSALAIILLKPNGSMDLKTAINSHVKTMKNYPLRITTAALVYFPVYLHLALWYPSSWFRYTQTQKIAFKSPHSQS